MERLDEKIKQVRRTYLETVQDILNTDLEESVKILKIKVEYDLLNRTIEDFTIEYQIEKHYSELPF